MPAPDTFPRLLLQHAQRAASGRRSARRISASGRPGRGAGAGRGARLACGLAHARAPARRARSPSSATTARGSTGRCCAAQALGGDPGAALPGRGRRRSWRSSLNNAEVAFAIVEDQEQVDKLLEVAAAVPALAHICLRRPARPAPLRRGAASRLRRAAASAGATSTRARPDFFDARSRAGPRPTTSRSCSSPRAPPGKPKGVVHTHRNLIETARGRRAVRAARPPTRRCSPTCRWRGSASTSSRYAQWLVAGFTRQLPRVGRTR